MCPHEYVSVAASLGGGFRCVLLIRMKEGKSASCPHFAVDFRYVLISM